ncbi:carboxymuconolactone decarboxylase family protein [Aureimonas leprariae]|uniref:Carboxymuconolactone decarboxylase family protein n=1 Tax=Plantimonas leprariae TaxID=2615207 RepID=A0A7V7TVR6_9HYPH|nr:carboxymuconolactone decarboxylase family protein [Aureimonas leprariae]KAB0678526.1 carboxymuconolactone decarboxylase family protein [Aureimonas leprariae]
MHIFPIHSLDTAPEKSRPALQALQSAFGFVPNIAAAMSTSPVLIDSLVGLFDNVHGGSFSEREIQTLLLTNAVTNRAEWAVAFHSFLALQQGIDADDVEAIRSGRTPKDPKLAALSRLAKTLIEKRGRISGEDRGMFLIEGFGPEHLLEVVAVVAASTITNYTASLTEPPLEAEFRPHAWSAGGA